MKRSIIALASLTAIFLHGCSSTQQITALKPEPGNSGEVVYQNTTSFISMPVTIGVADVEAQVNKMLNGVIYEDKDIDDDKIMMSVTKTAPIKFSEENGLLKSIVPIKVNAHYKYGTSALGINMYDTREFDLNAVVTLTSKVGLSNWKMTTETTIESFEWQESPTMTVAGKKVAITYLVNPAMKYFKSKIEKKLDESLAKISDFRPQVLAALEKISTPILTSEKYETWFKLVPQELYVTDASLSKKQITMDMGMKCTMQTLVGEKPKATFKKEDVVLKAVKQMPDKISAAVAAVSTFENASKIVTKNFQGQEFASGKRKVVVQKVDLWSKDNKVIIALQMTGSINGTIYLTGIPNYNAVTKEIYFDQMAYVLDTKSVLMRTANWLAEGYILKKIQESCRYSIKENLEEGKKNLQPYLNNYSPMPGVFINGTVNDFEFEKVEITNNAIIAFIKGSGTMNLKVDGLK